MHLWHSYSAHAHCDSLTRGSIRVTSNTLFDLAGLEGTFPTHYYLVDDTRSGGVE